MLEGIFRESPADAHVGLRARMLGDGAPLSVWTDVHSRQAGDGGAVLDDAARATLQATGILAVQLDAPMSNESFIEFGQRLGNLIPETDPKVLPRVDNGVLLNLVTDYGASAEVALQPFATSALTLHSESSGRAADEQPRYVVLMCCDPGADGALMPTVLSPMDGVADRLPDGARQLLAALRYRNGNPPTILREREGRPVFSFRDFQTDPLEWRCSGDAGDPEAVNDALRALLISMYAGEAAKAVSWRVGLLVVIDNQRFFHGRGAARDARMTRRRHLKRLRIGSACATPAGLAM